MPIIFGQRQPSKKRDNGPSFVYFAKHKKWPAIKIGCSANLFRRVGQLSRDHGEVEIIAAIPGSRSDERRIQKLFESARLQLAAGTPNRTEWFRATRDILDFGAGNTVPLKPLAILPYRPQNIARRRKSD